MNSDLIDLAVKSGKPQVLKILYNGIKDTPYYDNNFVKTSIKLFEQLANNSTKYEGKSEEKIKRKIYPLIRCLINRPDLFMSIIDHYKKLNSVAKNVIDEKFDQLIQLVFNTKDRILKLLGYLINKIDEKDPDGFKEDTKLIIKIVNALKNKKNLGKIVINIISELFESKTSTFLNLFSTIDPNLIYQMLFKKYIKNKKTEDVLNVLNIWKIDPSDFIIGLIFLSVHPENVEFLTNLLKKIIDSLLIQIDKRELNDKIIKKINLLEEKDFPITTAFVVLKLAEYECSENKPIDAYVEIFRKGINNQYYNNKMFWQYLLEFCKLDRILAEETISSLLPEDKRQEFYEDYRKIRRST